MRSDLIVAEQTVQGRRCRMLKDPVSLKYFRFEEEEYFLLSQLDGLSTATEIVERFQKKFAPRTIEPRSLHRFLVSLHRAGLAVSDASRQGEEIGERRRKRRTAERTLGALNWMGTRIAHFDPDRLLSALVPTLGLLFTRIGIVASVLFGLAALALVLCQLDVFLSKLPTFEKFFAADNWLWLLITLGGVKVLHELGHGVACKRFGRECREMGLLLLVLIPTPYCDVTDAWMIPEKRKRALIGMAGMLVELNLAALCTFLWWWSKPGLFHSLCLNVIFVSSISTLAVNLNPLLRYDGYFILSDLLEIPNLSQKAFAALKRFAGRVCLGIVPEEDPFLPTKHRTLFAAFAVASVCYRVFVTVSILWFFNSLMEPYGLKIVGQLLAASVVAGMIVKFGLSGVKFLGERRRKNDMGWFNLAATTAATAALVYAALAVPTPTFVVCPVQVRSEGSIAVYVDTPGTLAEVFVRPGQQVREGDVIARLENREIGLRIASLVAERDEAIAGLEAAKRLRYEDAAAEAEIPGYLEQIAALDRQIEARKIEQSRLVVLAAGDGAIVPAAWSAEKKDDALLLPRHSGTPLERENFGVAGAALDAGSVLCRIVRPDELRAALAVPGDDLELIAAEQPVEILLDAYPQTKFRSKVGGIAPSPMEVAPTALASRNGGDLLSQPGPSGAEVPVETTYEASAPLPTSGTSLFCGATGMARIRVEQKTVAQRLWRWSCKTFTFDL
jgi:putative peptide zinc metalloprotease protein